MKSKILNISPFIDRGDGNNMCEAVRTGLKQQTIRKYAIPEGTTLHIWAKKRGMRIGAYCPFCLRMMQHDKLFCENHLCKNNYNNEGSERYTMKDWDRLRLPKKLLQTTALEPIPIALKISEDWLGVRVDTKKFLRPCESLWGKPDIDSKFGHKIWGIETEEPLHPFAKNDGFTTNRAMIDFFSRYLKEGWNQLYINRWKYPEVKL